MTKNKSTDKVKYNPDGKIQSLSITINNKYFNIEIFAYSYYLKENEMSIGHIIEKYRLMMKNKDSNKDNYFKQNKKNILDFLNKCKYPFPEYKPDYVTLFFPTDKNLKSIFNRLKQQLNIVGKFDYSEYFSKIDKNISIKDKKDNFRYDKPKIDKPPEQILLIDDMIDQGDTIEQLLNLMDSHNLLTEKTEIKAICIYYRKKSKPDKKAIEAILEQTKQEYLNNKG